MIIGIDPNFTSKGDDRIGVAIIENSFFSYIGVFSLLGLFGKFKEAAATGGGLLIIEAPSKTLHNAAAVFRAAASSSGTNAAAKITAKRAADVGALWMQSRIIAEYAKGLGLEVIEVDQTRRRRCDVPPLDKLSAKQLEPLTRGGLPQLKKYLSKLDAARFKQLTGWTKRTNDDGRDAALLIIEHLKRHG